MNNLIFFTPSKISIATVIISYILIIGGAVTYVGYKEYFADVGAEANIDRSKPIVMSDNTIYWAAEENSTLMLNSLTPDNKLESLSLVTNDRYNPNSIEAFTLDYFGGSGNPLYYFFQFDAYLQLLFIMEVDTDGFKIGIVEAPEDYAIVFVKMDLNSQYIGLMLSTIDTENNTLDFNYYFTTLSPSDIQFEEIQEKNLPINMNDYTGNWEKNRLDNNEDEFLSTVSEKYDVLSVEITQDKLIDFPSGILFYTFDMDLLGNVYFHVIAQDNENYFKGIDLVNSIPFMRYNQISTEFQYWDIPHEGNILKVWKNQLIKLPIYTDVINKGAFDEHYNYTIGIQVIDLSNNATLLVNYNISQLYWLEPYAVSYFVEDNDISLSFSFDAYLLNGDRLTVNPFESYNSNQLFSVFRYEVTLSEIIENLNEGTLRLIRGEDLGRFGLKDGKQNTIENGRVNLSARRSIENGYTYVYFISFEIIIPHIADKYYNSVVFEYSNTYGEVLFP